MRYGMRHNSVVINTAVYKTLNEFIHIIIDILTVLRLRYPQPLAISPTVVENSYFGTPGEVVLQIQINRSIQQRSAPDIRVKGHAVHARAVAFGGDDSRHVAAVS